MKIAAAVVPAARRAATAGRLMDQPGLQTPPKRKRVRRHCRLDGMTSDYAAQSPRSPQSSGTYVNSCPTPARLARASRWMSDRRSGVRRRSQEHASPATTYWRRSRAGPVRFKNLNGSPNVIGLHGPARTLASTDGTLQLEGPLVHKLSLGGEWIRTFGSAILIMLRSTGPSDTDRCTTEQRVERVPAYPALSSRPPVNSNSMSSGLAEVNPFSAHHSRKAALFAPVRKIVPRSRAPRRTSKSLYRR